MHASVRRIRAPTNRLVPYWLSFEIGAPARDETLGAGVYQVMAMVAPYFEGPARALFERLAEQYVRAW